MPRMLKSVPRLLSYAPVLIGLTLPVSCSSSGGGGDFDEARQEYEQTATQEATKFADAAAPSFVQQLATIGTEGGKPNEVQVLLEARASLKGPGSALGDTLCSAFRRVADVAGSGKSADERLDETRKTTARILRDDMIRSLLAQVLATPSETQNRLFDLLGVVATSADGSQLRGTAALDNKALLQQGSNAIAVPARGTQEYEDFERWLLGDGQGLRTNADGLSGTPREAVNDCEAKAD
jgi:hypothetical protein